MILVSYDIKDDKLRTRFSKFLKKYGDRLQYSVYEISNSDRLLNNVIFGVRNYFEPEFSEDDSVMIFKLSKSCEIIFMGNAKHLEEPLIVI